LILPRLTFANVFKLVIVAVIAASFLRLTVRDVGTDLLAAAGDLPELVATIGKAAATTTLPDQLAGKAQIYDGDTFDLLHESLATGRYQDASRIRLDGVDACESRQTATFDGVKWPCGAVATAWLVSQTLGKQVVCKPARMDRYGRLLSRCSTAGQDLGLAGVREGMMIVYRYKDEPTAADYEAAEAEAKSNRRGLWSGSFIDPRDFRRQNGSYNPFEPAQ